MIFEQSRQIESFGEKIGFIFSYLLFTTILFLILMLLNKIPETWTYFNVMGIALLVVLTGFIIKRFLK